MMGLGMGEIMVILVLALMVFGPRKLPELGKTLGQAMNQFRRASDEFKRTWEQEVEYDKVRTEGKSTSSTISETSSADSGYTADSDYQYGYDTGYDGATGSDPLPTEATTASTETNVETPSVEKKAEPQWI
ncbi:MAG: hypothetical protein HOP19_17425 [Acidobacteria bacterium]|nr:hypothetical protein [Acidobacteriota bacterium]